MSAVRPRLAAAEGPLGSTIRQGLGRFVLVVLGALGGACGPVGQRDAGPDSGGWDAGPDASPSSCPDGCAEPCEAGQECVEGACVPIPLSCGPSYEGVAEHGVDAADVRTLARLPGVVGTTLAGTRSGIWARHDGACSWEFLGMPGQEVTALAVGPDGTIWAGTYFNGIHRLAPSARGFERLLPAGRPVSVTDVEIDPTDPDVAYLTGMIAPVIPFEDGALYATVDGGREWRRIFDRTSEAELRAVSAAPTEPAVLWIATCLVPPVGIYRTDDRGASWAAVDSFPHVCARDVLVEGSDRSTVWAVDGTGRLWASDDGGASWIDSTPESVEVEHVAAGVDGSPFRVVLTGRFDGAVGLGVDGRWARLLGEHHANVALAIGPTVLLGHAAGVDTVEGVEGTAADWSHGMNGVTVYEIAFGEEHTFAATDVGIFRAAAGGRSWARVGEDDLPVGPAFRSVALDPSDDGTVYAGISTIGLPSPPAPRFWLSRDSGVSWEAASDGLPEGFDVLTISVRAPGGGRACSSSATTSTPPGALRSSRPIPREAGSPSRGFRSRSRRAPPARPAPAGASSPPASGTSGPPSLSKYLRTITSGSSRRRA